MTVQESPALTNRTACGERVQAWGVSRAFLYPVGMIDRLPTSRNPMISVFEVRSIAIGEYFYILLELSIY
jgi:hypothetical protein